MACGEATEETVKQTKSSQKTFSLLLKAVYTTPLGGAQDKSKEIK